VTRRLPVAAALFDVDGTLIDSNAAHAEAWTRALRENGVPVEMSCVRPLIGMGGDKLLPEVAHVSEDSELGQRIAKRKKVIFASLLPRLQPTRGARALVEYLRQQKIELAIATSAGDEELDELLKRAGVDDLFPRRASKDDAAESKPDPDIVHAALAKTHATSERAVMIGDTPYDIEAARRSGVAAIALRCGGHWTDADFKGAVEICDDPAALLGYWQTRFAAR
jgi:HAD superfamily hydrolase (TIGR01509 family)